MIPAVIAGLGPTIARAVKANAPAFVVRASRMTYASSAGILTLAIYTGWKNQRNGKGFLRTLQTGDWSAEDADNPKSHSNGHGKSSTTTVEHSGPEPFPIAELLGPWNDPKGHPTHLHMGSEDVQFVVYVGRNLQRMGFDVSEHPLFGGVQPVHTTNSMHYRRRAIDINWRGEGDETQKLKVAAQFIRDYATNLNVATGTQRT